MSYLIAFLIGAVIGTALTMFLLSPNMLKNYQKTSLTVSDSYAAAKAVYKAEVYGSDSEKTGEGEEK